MISFGSIIYQEIAYLKRIQLKLAIQPYNPVVVWKLKKLIIN